MSRNRTIDTQAHLFVYLYSAPLYHQLPFALPSEIVVKLVAVSHPAYFDIFQPLECMPRAPLGDVLYVFYSVRHRPLDTFSFHLFQLQ